MGNLQSALAPALQNLINGYERDLGDAKAEIERLRALGTKIHRVAQKIPDSCLSLQKEILALASEISNEQITK